VSGYPGMRCENCGRLLSPCPGKLHATGERSYVGYYPCPCDEARAEDADREEWYAQVGPLSGGNRPDSSAIIRADTVATVVVRASSLPIHLSEGDDAPSAPDRSAVAQSDGEP